MRCFEITSNKPPTAEQHRIRNLRHQVEVAKSALAAENLRQQKKKETDRAKRAAKKLSVQP